MQQVLSQMLSKYQINNIEDKKNAIKEIVQEIVLCGLSRGGFFKEAAFYGGTALRIFYGLDRFSEDLDFSLITQNPDFDLTKYFPYIENETKSLGLNFNVTEKIKSPRCSKYYIINIRIITIIYINKKFATYFCS